MAIGPFRAGVSITVFGIIEGAIAFTNTRSVTTSEAIDFGHPVDWLIQGQWGIIGEIYGSVAFAIVSVEVRIEVYAAVGVRLRKGGTVTIWIDAGIVVEARVVIADFDALFVHVHNEVDFSFSAHLHWERTLDGHSLLQLEAETTPLNWTRYKYYPTPKALPIYFYFEPSVVASKLNCILLLALETSPVPSNGTPAPRKSFDDLAEAFAAWTLTLYSQQFLNGADNFTAEDLKRLTQILSVPRTLARTPVSDPLDSAHIKQFLEDNFGTTVYGPLALQNAVTLAFFPLMSDCSVIFDKDGTPVKQIDFWTQTPIDTEYEDALANYLDTQRFRFTSDTRSALRSQSSTTKVPFVEFLSRITSMA